MATRFTRTYHDVYYSNNLPVETSTRTVTYTADAGYTFVSGEITEIFGGPTELPITSTGKSTILVTKTTIVPSTTLALPTSASTMDTTAVALSSIASYNSIQATATDSYTKSHLSSAISQWSSWASLSSGTTTLISSITSTGKYPTTGITVIALSQITSWNSIASTATDPILKGSLQSAISQASSMASLTSGAYTAVITISPSEQSAIDKSNKGSARDRLTYTVVLSVIGILLLIASIWMLGYYFVRKRRQRRGKNMPPPTEHLCPNIDSLDGLMVEMGRKSATGEQESSRAEGLQPMVSRTHSTLLELEPPEGIAELPGSNPVIELPEKRAELYGDGAVNSERIHYEV
ncbi:e7622bb4-02c5-45c8-aaac-32690487298a-CDS [Sclerotinia trifoliorum]|uniref:E7622bb4-02c5-45c8-aaac-32690487298a-CDS n=1 Tax=Sclerotinia trifoliorum TaxID=28548 RepID=A0A8H2VQ43_9HELO|nr:e7622bb4-02c5-45c8-aaac-32690487298a-CDS [Sclerotinia trifoliorum]